MRRLFFIVVCLSVVSALPFLCREPGDMIRQTGTCGPELTSKQQGSCLCCYNNTADIPTIGIGFNLLRYDAREKLDAYNLRLEDVLDDCRDRTTKSCLTNEEVMELYNTVTYPELKNNADNYVKDLPPLAKAAVADISLTDYEKLQNEADFPNFRALLSAGNFSGASAALQTTRWCKSVSKQRCESNVKCIGSLCSPGTECSNSYASCSSNPYCYCHQTNQKFNVCTPSFYCNQYRDCSNCPIKTSVCVTKGCCGNKCIPLSLLNACPPKELNSLIPVDFGAKPQTKCLQDSDCPNGQFCGLYSVGKFCRKF